MYEESTSEYIRTVVLKHGRGAKWSIQHGEWASLAVEKLLGLKIETEKTEDQVISWFPEDIDKEQGRLGITSRVRQSTIEEKKF